MLFLKFYVTEAGRNPVGDFLGRELWRISSHIGNRLRLLSKEFPDAKRVEIKPLRGKLWELKMRIEKKNYRIIYAVIGTDLVLLHAFIKKKGRAQDEIKLAEKRFKDYLQRYKR